MAVKWEILKFVRFLESWFNICIQSSISNKYFKYLSESPAKNSLGQKHVSGLRLFLSGDTDKYLKYLLLIEPQTFKSISPWNQQF